ncbi:FliM/FliN family flagellar motor switch protein [Aeromonas diversa]|uniref:FliM/FliN family flagellar motor switch protein n=1 Tax=Aeromonas diversa TaxID=502790 RepID=UPI0039A04906
MPSTFTRSALIPAELGATLPRYDLFGRERAEQARLNGFNSLFCQVAAPLSASLSQLFNSADCELQLTPFAANQQPDAEETRVWLQARAAGASIPQAWFAITPATLYRLAILFFGGSLQPGSQVAVQKNPSDSELRLFQRLCRYQMEHLCGALGWGDLGWEVTPATPPEGDLWSCEGVLQLGEHRQSWQLWWRPPVDEEKESTQAHNLADKLHEALPHTPVQLRVVLAQMQMTLAELEGLKVGEVLALDMYESMPALIGHRPCLRGRVAEQGGSLVYQVNAVAEE